MYHKPYIIPAPQSFEWNQEIVFPLYLCDGILICPDLSKKTAGFHHARLLQNTIEEATGLHIPIAVREISGPHKIWLRTDFDLEKDTYVLGITQDHITVSGAGEREVLWGVQTLRQIISQEGALLHGALIQDYPQIRHRGFYHDTTRGRIPDLAALKRLADRCSYYKINELQFYVEHSYLFRGCSEVWRDETPLTAEEIMEFDQYCQMLGIDLIPSISTFGHLYKMLGTKTFSSLCELDDSEGQPFSFGNRMAHHTLDASDPRALKLMKERIDEYMSLFSSKYFNICADETFDIGHGKTKDLVARLGRESVYIRFVDELCQHVARRGKIPMFWGDIIASDPKKAAILPNGTICLNWGYAPDQDDSSVKAFHSVGVKQYVCPGVQGWNSLINVMPDAYANISRMCTYAHQYEAEGVLNTDWGDMGHPNHPDFSAFGLILGAAFSWNSHIPSFDEICRQVSVVEYRDFSETVMDCIAKISTKAIMNWTTAVLFKEDSQGLFEGSSFAQYFQSHKKNMLDGLSLQKYVSVNTELAKLTLELSSYLGQAQAPVKYTLTCFINAAKGQHIFNTIALHLWYKERGGQRPDAPGTHAPGKNDPLQAQIPSPFETAAMLETWFMSYKDIWRKQGKEADLYRLQEVINWYGDYLREM